MKTFEWIILKNPFEVQELHTTGALLVHPLAEWKPRHIINIRAGSKIFGLIISKSTQRLGACGGQISLGSIRRQEGLARGFGPCWGPLSSEGPQKHDLTMSSKCDI
jgi:hypothetical protein